MEYWTSLISTFIGALLGFIFSLCLFYLVNKWNRNLQRKSLQKNLIKEFEFNGHYLQSLLGNLNKAIEKINADDKKLYYYCYYKDFQRLFIHLYFQQGIHYEKLNPDDINLLITILNHMTQDVQYFVNSSIQSWKDTKISQQEILDILRFQRDTIEKFIKDIGQIKKKISTNKL